mmetsp:Transcript_33164/g.83621  ORF Transcript_33164/g.83621 Transcript_33164/m.83621 type:complete len:204 (-) Transcript_33164:8-619(-)
MRAHKCALVVVINGKGADLLEREPTRKHLSWYRLRILVADVHIGDADLEVAQDSFQVVLQAALPLLSALLALCWGLLLRLHLQGLLPRLDELIFRLVHLLPLVGLLQLRLIYVLAGLRLAGIGYSQHVDAVQLADDWLAAEIRPWHLELERTQQARLDSDGQIELVERLGLELQVVQLHVAAEHRYLERGGVHIVGVAPQVVI